MLLHWKLDPFVKKGHDNSFIHSSRALDGNIFVVIIHIDGEVIKVGVSTKVLYLFFFVKSKIGSSMRGRWLRRVRRVIGSCVVSHW